MNLQLLQQRKQHRRPGSPFFRAWAFGLGFTMLSACQPDSITDPAANSSVNQLRLETLGEVRNSISTVSSNLLPAAEFNPLLEQLLNSLNSDFDLLLARYQQFDAAVRTLLNDPSQQSLNEARTQWHSALNSYERTAFTRYLLRVATQGTDAEQPLSIALSDLEYLINAWPILPGYLDYLPNYPQSGIVNDITLPLDESSIRDQHRKFDSAEATLGFHVIEFLLWGSANPISPSSADSAAATTYFLTRPFEDFIDIGPALGITREDSGTQRTDSELENTEELPYQNNNPRRRELLSLTTTLLQQDVNELVQLGQQSSSLLQQRFQTASAETALLILVNSASTLLSEEILTRSLYPLLNGDHTEGLQSQFSRSTQQVVIAQLSSIEDLFLNLRNENGYSLESAITSLDAGLVDNFGDSFFKNLDASKECLTRLYASIHEEGNQNSATTLAQSNSVSATSAQRSVDRESEIVECINLVNNMVNSLDIVKQRLLSPTSAGASNALGKLNGSGETVGRDGTGRVAETVTASTEEDL